MDCIALAQKDCANAIHLVPTQGHLQAALVPLRQHSVFLVLAKAGQYAAQGLAGGVWEEGRK